MAIRVLVNGAKGKMGQATMAAVTADEELQLVAGTDLGDDLAAVIKSSGAQVAVDFTHPSVVLQNIITIIDSGACPVVGTTGFKPEDIAALQKKAKDKNIGGLIAPNFSIGAILMMRYAADAARYMPRAEIIEYHHDNKADAPSGTATRTAELMLASNPELRGPNVESREDIPHALGARMGNLRVHAVRLPGFLASQEVILGAPGQTLRLRHETINRECFMPGIVLACKKVVLLTELAYGLEHLL